MSRKFRLDIDVQGAEAINKKMEELQEALNKVSLIAQDLGRMGADVHLKMPPYPWEYIKKE